MYEVGDGVPQDYKLAVKWYRLAADQGNASAQTNLGFMYEIGKGVPQDLVQAHLWFNLAAANGKNVGQYRDDIARMMTQDQIAEAQRLSREWKPTQPTAAPVTPQPTPATRANVKVIPMLNEGGVYVVPVLINETITLKFVVDSGAADVSIPADVVTTLMRAGSITDSDFVGAQTYTLADGSTTSSRTFRIRSLKIGDIVLQNVRGSVANSKGALLLGQSALGRFKSWSTDNTTHALVLTLNAP
jgi:clan AA aspartic protease (TIGR02281 family)